MLPSVTYITSNTSVAPVGWGVYVTNLKFHTTTVSSSILQVIDVWDILLWIFITYWLIIPWEIWMRNVIFSLDWLIGIFTFSHDNVPRWMPQGLTDDKSTLVQVMGWCHQAISHYLSQCWPRSVSPYDVTRPQWVKVWGHLDMYFGVTSQIWDKTSNFSTMNSNCVIIDSSNGL